CTASTYSQQTCRRGESASRKTSTSAQGGPTRRVSSPQPTSLIPRSEKDREEHTKPGRLIGPYAVAVWGPFFCPDLGNTPNPMQLEGNPRCVTRLRRLP